MKFLKPAFTASVLSLFIQNIYAEVNILPTITVNALEEKDQGYIVQHNLSASRFELNDLETPQNIQTITSDVLTDINAQRITDAIPLISGVSQLNPMGGLWDNFSIRGFNTDQTIGLKILRNGINAYLGTNAPHNLVNIERMEFLKGPEAALYGSGEPGGSLNIITKKPEFKTKHTVELRAGSYDQYRATFDSTGALSDQAAYRIGLSYEDNHSFRDYVKNDTLFIAPQLTWRLSDHTQIDYDSEYTIINSLFDRGVLAVNHQLGKISQNRFLGEPADGLMDMEDFLQQLRIRHEWNAMWQTETTLNYKHNHWQGYSSEAYQLLNNQGDLNRERRYRHYDTTSYLFNNDLKGQFNIGNLQHKVVINTELSQLEILQNLHRYRIKNSQATEINIYNPIYGINLPATSLAYNTTEKQTNIGLSVNDYIEFNPQWSVLVGGRLDHFKQDFSEEKSQIDGSQNFTHFSPKAAINFLQNDQLSFYASIGQSFHLNSGLSIDQKPFDPEKAWTYEFGTKTRLFNDRLSSTLSVFHITKDNVLTLNPNDSAYMLAAGQEQSKGIELDITAQLADKLNIKFNYAYTDATVSKSNDTSILVGSRLLNSPKHSANFLAMYKIWQSGERNIGIGGNIQYVSERAGDPNINSFKLPAYTLLNLNTYYQINEKLRTQLTINNLTNKNYYSSSLKEMWVSPGNPREAFLSLSYKFD